MYVYLCECACIHVCVCILCECACIHVCVVCVCGDWGEVGAGWLCGRIVIINISINIIITIVCLFPKGSHLHGGLVVKASAS